MSTMTRQDLLAVTEVAKNKIIERLVTKYDVQAACDSVGNKILGAVQSMQLENQAMIRQINAQRDLSWRKVAALEGQMADLQKEIKAMHRLISAFLEDAGRSSQSSPSDLSASFPVK